MQDILVSADMIGLTEVVSKCTEFLKCELHESNAIGIELNFVLFLISFNLLIFEKKYFNCYLYKTHGRKCDIFYSLFVYH